MKKALRIVAVMIAIGSIAYWAAAGANRGWTKTSVPKKIVDEVTGIEGVRYEKRFVPGVDFLVLALGGAGVLAGISLLLRKKSDKPSNKT
ncbi:MAG TPA: hypothetical protein VFY06_11000 [Verrucomicrobiae bacterium]|nr:hypothetical protein [Verrucomicrobiae bacterium]